MPYSSLVITGGQKHTHPKVMHCLLAYYEVIHWRLFPWAVLNNVQLKAYIFAGRVFHEGDFNVAHLIVLKKPLEVPHD